MEVRASRRPKREVEGKKSAIKAALDKLSRVRKGIAEDKYNMKEEENLFIEGEEAGQSDDDDFLVDDTPSIKTFFSKRKKSGYDSESDEDDYYDDDEEDLQEKVKSKKIKPPKPSAMVKPIKVEEPEEIEENSDDAYEIMASASKRLKGMFGSKNNTPQSSDRRRSALLKPLEASRSPSQKRKLDQDSTDSTKSKTNSSTAMERKKVKIDFDSIQQPEPIKLFEEEPDNFGLNDELDDGPDIPIDFGGEVESWTFGLKGIADEENVTQTIGKDLTFFTDKDGVTHLKMYWLDAFEDTSIHAGRAYIFGKIKVKSDAKSSGDYISCCLIVENISRKVYLLPAMRGDNRIPVAEVHKEFTEKIAPKYKIKLYKTRKVTKFYSFDQADVPYQADYLEVVYGSNYSALSPDLKGETFNRVFNTTQTPLERMILEVNLKGPGWIRVKNLQLVHNQVSWCKKEFSVDYSPKNISVETNDVTIPPLLIASLNMRTHLNQVVALSCFVKKDYQIDAGIPSSPLDLNLSFCLVTSPTGQTLPVEFKRAAKKFIKGHEDLIKSYDNEQYMLNQFLVNFGKLDPDVIIGHDSAFDLNTILTRQSHFNDKVNWSRLGRLRRTRIILSKSNRDRMALTAGRLVCDIKVMAKEFIRTQSYELDGLIAHLLKKERLIGPKSVPEAYSNCKNLFSFVNALLADNRFIMSMMYELSALPLAMQITKIAGNLFSRTLMGGRAERNEYLLLHAFNEKNFILPDKVMKKYNDPKADELVVLGEKNSEAVVAGKKKAAYSGGLVLEPKAGFYDSHILLMDFNSLYPSIIQEYNICFTTVSKRRVKIDENGDEIPEVPDPSKPCGILPTEIKKLVEGRREVKRLMLQEKSADLHEQLNVKQTALKLTANSMYGCLGFTQSRFYAKPLAALITYKGREILINTKNLVESLGLEVIYGDTDSIMINIANCTDYDDVMKTGRKVQAEVNKIYRLLEIGIDGVYKPMLLLKKKKYAALALTRDKNGVKKKLEMKGLDIVRRDWSLVAKRAGELVLKEILSDKSNQEVVDAIHERLKKISDRIKENIFTPEQLKEFEIIKSLTKNPEDYQDKKGLIHVNVALRRNASDKVERKFKAGDIVPYVICVDESNKEFMALPSTQRAFHPDELKENPSLKIDSNYYISQQILPVISRLCEPIEGTDSHIMAEIMGVESTGLHRSSREELENEVPLDEEMKFDAYEAFKILCPNDNCGKLIEFRDQFRIDSVTKKRINLSLARCPHCNIDLTLEKFENRIINNFILNLRNKCDEFTKNWIKCINCSFRTRCCWGYQRGLKKILECPKCSEDMDQEVTDKNFHYQLLFYETLLDREGALNSLSSASEKAELETKTASCTSLYQSLYQLVRSLRLTMSYTDVNLSNIFHSQLFSCIKKQNKN
ncbi:DNA polymerase alpha catalytic subunit-like [Panonychus citri]|uniref:DNA polymerase alpha catalytic subunit-like n=1 Tax=Panonychus citri TaxID=50023 RepID=UPI00230739CD|nr:DNA polymerase alpha catalytic subunit-like [Panonychus citri]